jgi:hypothetical protein
MSDKATQFKGDKSYNVRPICKLADSFVRQKNERTIYIK